MWIQNILDVTSAIIDVQFDVELDVAIDVVFDVELDVECRWTRRLQKAFRRIQKQKAVSILDFTKRSVISFCRPAYRQQIIPS